MSQIRYEKSDKDEDEGGVCVCALVCVCDGVHLLVCVGAFGCVVVCGWGWGSVTGRVSVRVSGCVSVFGGPRRLC